jgi:hypothetical protein
MLKRILVSGALGGVALAVWTFVANAIFGFANRVEMNQIPNERAVYQVLRENIVTPGVYLANPALTPEGQFPPGEPVFSVRYSGIPHGLAGRMALVEPAFVFATSILVAWLLSMTSSQVLSRYSRKVAFVLVIGLLLAVSGDLAKIGIGGYPVGSALMLAANRIGSWVVAGLVMARSMRVQRT